MSFTNITETTLLQNADEFQWDFGDGATMTNRTTEEPVTHEYTKAGTHIVTLTAIKQGEPPQTTTATLAITVNPAALDMVTIPPKIEVAAGGTEQLEAVVTDQYGNRVREVDVVWTVTDSDAGSVTRTGLFEAGEVAGAFGEVVKVEVTQRELLRTAAALVTVAVGTLEQMVIAPDPVEIGMEMTQQFVAVGADQYGNRISGLAFTWSVENGGGTIDEAGLFTAGTIADTYQGTVKAEATQGDITRSATADVTVEPDRIVFTVNRNDEQYDIYIMDADGSNQERLTTSGVEGDHYAFSPDGRRIVYGAGGNILTINDDGTWNIALLSGRRAYEPAWSPDGTEIGFHSWHDTDQAEIYVMDVGGGNLTRLTDNSADDISPAWSPDGTKIAFTSDRDGNREIYVMNADGSNQRRLTDERNEDIYPTWSPDGAEILFQSDRDHRGIYIMNADGTNVRRLTSTSYSSNCPDWSPDGTKIGFHSWRDPDQAELYIMDRDGSNLTRLTTNSNNDYSPEWAPRKSGIEVTEDSVIIPDTSTLKDMTVQEVTTQARKAVVRIKTDLGSASGFVIDPSGLVLTNNHVVSDAEEITVYLEDGTSYNGTVESRDLIRDLALVKIEVIELSYLELGDLSEVDLGQQVIVVGYPLGAKDVAVTGGLVSSIQFDSGRNIIWVQTDSAINLGNSGGPMLNLRGQVIGVVAAKFVGIDIEGVGFAISANTVNMYLPRLQTGDELTIST
ncbi:trypsin-like peptidase domain-containing protein [Chloroflexota bacterium]